MGKKSKSKSSGGGGGSRGGGVIPPSASEADVARVEQESNGTTPPARTAEEHANANEEEEGSTAPPSPSLTPTPKTPAAPLSTLAQQTTSSTSSSHLEPKPTFGGGGVSTHERNRERGGKEEEVPIRGNPFAFSAPEADTAEEEEVESSDAVGAEADETLTEADEREHGREQEQRTPGLTNGHARLHPGQVQAQPSDHLPIPNPSLSSHSHPPADPAQSQPITEPNTPALSEWPTTPMIGSGDGSKPSSRGSSPARKSGSQDGAVKEGRTGGNGQRGEGARVDRSRSKSRSRASSSTSPVGRPDRTSSSHQHPHSPPTDRHHQTPPDHYQEPAQIAALQDELDRTRAERDQLNAQYRGLLGKLTQMRSSLGDKLREDAEELDRRETQINQLHAELTESSAAIETLRSELSHSSSECATLTSQLSQLRASSSSSSSDVLALTRELRELRGELEMVRVEREEWEMEAGRERERRERVDEEARFQERLFREEEARRRAAEDGWEMEKQRARNLQDVLGEFQAAKDLEIEQATSELEGELRQVVQTLSDYKLRAAEAESRLGNYKNDASKSTQLDRELKEKNATIGKLRHEAVVTQEHLTEALRRLRRNSSDTNVDRRLVTNILLQFLGTPRADPKRFEMLSLLSTILSWEDDEREKAGLQRSGGAAGPSKSVKRKGSMATVKGGEREKTQAEMDTFNESFSNLFVEFLLKEAAQGQSAPAAYRQDRPNNSFASPPGSTIATSPPPGSSYGGSSMAVRPGHRPRTYSNSSINSTTPSAFGSAIGVSQQQPHVKSPTGSNSDRFNPSYGRKVSFGPTGAPNQSLAMSTAMGQAGSSHRAPSPRLTSGNGGVPLPREGQQQSAEGYSNTRML